MPRENHNSKRCMHPNAYCSTIYNARTAEATQMSINSIMDKEDVVYVCSFAKLCPSLCHPMDCSLPGSSVHGIFQARILEWVTISYSRGCSQSRDQTHIFYISCTGRQILYQLHHPNDLTSFVKKTIFSPLSCI